MVPTLLIDRSTPDRKIDKPIITPIDPRINLISKSLPTPTKKFRINTRITIGITAFEFSFTLSKNMENPSLNS